MVKEKMFLRDVVATKILKAEECREYLASIIAAVLEIDKNYVLNNLKLLDTEVSQNIHNKDQEVDILVENQEMVVNIEINTLNTKQSRMKNNAYIAQLIIKQTFPGKLYNIKPIVQINVECFDAYLKNEFIYHSVMMEEKYHIKRMDSNIDIYDINLDFLSELDYNQVRNLSETDLKWLLYIFVCQDETLKRNLYSGNSMMRKVEKKMEEFMKEFNSLFYYNHEEFRKRDIEEYREELRKEMEKELREEIKVELRKELTEEMVKEIKMELREEVKDEVINQVKEEGIEQGSKLAKLEMAKKLLSKNKSSEEIHEFTDLSIEEIEELK